MRLAFVINWNVCAFGFAITTWSICLNIGPLFIELRYDDELEIEFTPEEKKQDKDTIN